MRLPREISDFAMLSFSVGRKKEDSVRPSWEDLLEEASIEVMDEAGDW